MNRYQLSKIINSGLLCQRMSLLAEEIARVKYGYDNLLSDFEFKALNKSFSTSEEKMLYNRYKRADSKVEKAIVNLNVIYEAIYQHQSVSNHIYMIEMTIQNAEQMVNSVLSEIKDKNERLKFATKSIQGMRFLLTESKIDKEGFVQLDVESRNNKMSLLDYDEQNEKVLDENIVIFLSWKKALIDYMNNINFRVPTYTNIINGLNDRLDQIIACQKGKKYQIDQIHYDWFCEHVL